MANGKLSKLPKTNGKTLGTDGMAILMVFIGAILGVVLLSSIADTEQDITTTKTAANNTVTLPASVGETVEVTGRDHIRTIEVINATNTSYEDWSGNVTITDGIGADGSKTVLVQLDGLTVDGDNINGSDANVSYEYGDYGYLNDSSDRSIANLIIIFGALGIFAFVVAVFLMKGYLGKLLGLRE